MRRVFVSLVVAMSVGAGASAVLAQNAPARETPRPQDIDPAVNTSAPPTSDTAPARDASSPPSAPARTAPTRETPRPQDLEPRVNTSAPSQTPSPSQSQPAEAATGAARGTTAGAAAPGTTQSSTPATASGARAPGANATNTAAAGGKGKSLDRLELDTTQITGNRELPKVLYIVPWKRSDLGDLVGKPVNSLLDEVLTPVDRDVFQRENRYYRALTPGAVENDALSAPDGGPTTPQRNPVRTNSAPAAGMPGSATHPTNTPPGGVSTSSGSAASPPRDEK